MPLTVVTSVRVGISLISELNPAGCRTSCSMRSEIDLIIDFTQCAFERAADGQGITRAQLAQVEDMLRGGGGLIDLFRREPQFLQHTGKVFAGGHSLHDRHHNLFAMALGIGLSQLHLFEPGFRGFGLLPQRIAD